MAFNLKEECDKSKKREFFYGAKINKNIKDAYFGLCYLEPGETERKAGPGKGHEELLYLTEGEIQIEHNNDTLTIKAGEVFFIPDKNYIKMKNLTDSRVYFMIAGGHTKHHSH